MNDQDWISAAKQLPEPGQLVDIITNYSQRYVDMVYSHTIDGLESVMFVSPDEHFFKNGRDNDKKYVRSGKCWRPAPTFPVKV